MQISFFPYTHVSQREVCADFLGIFFPSSALIRYCFSSHADRFTNCCFSARSCFEPFFSFNRRRGGEINLTLFVPVKDPILSNSELKVMGSNQRGFYSTLFGLVHKSFQVSEYGWRGNLGSAALRSAARPLNEKTESSRSHLWLISTSFQQTFLTVGF